MEGTMGNEGINKLAGVMQNRMKNMADKPAVLDIGQIGSDMSLTTNQFPKPIPQTDYLVCRQLTLGATGVTLTNTGSNGTHTHDGGSHGGHTGGNGEHTHSGGPHSHSIVLPEKMRSIKPGDRVLVAWVGDDVCVIDIILPGTAV